MEKKSSVKWYSQTIMLQNGYAVNTLKIPNVIMETTCYYNNSENTPYKTLQCMIFLWPANFFVQLFWISIPLSLTFGKSLQEWILYIPYQIKVFRGSLYQILFGPFFNNLPHLNSKTQLPCFDSLTLFKSQRIMTPFPAADAIKFSKFINHKVTQKKVTKNYSIP